MAKRVEDTTKITDPVLDALKNGRKIQAIKQLRQESGLGLKEAKEIVEAYVDENADVKAAFEANKSIGLSQERILQIAILAIVFIAVYMLA